MSKKLSFLMLLMVLFAPWAANAQETLTVHNGTTTNNYVPFYGLWVDDYTRSEMIYPANELSSMTDGVISSLSFYKSSSSTTSSWGSATFQVYLNEVTNTTLSAYIGMTNATIVYEGSIDASGGERQVTINFTTPYYYNGGNLLVGIYETTTGTYSSAYWYGENVTGASASGYNSSSPASATFNQRNFLPKTTFTYEVSSPSSCPKPINLTCTGITANTATLSWTERGDATQWQICLNGNESDPILVNTNPYTLTSLTAEQTYTAKVRAYCDSNDQSDWSNTCEFTPSETQVVTIGSGETTNTYLPAYTFYNYNLSEQIYTAEEVGMAGAITSISFFNGGSEKSPEIKIYMVNTDQSEFSSTTNWLTVTTNDLVYDGTVTFTVGEWTTIELDTPFEYDGTSNLGLIVDEHMQYSSGLACRVFTSTSNCSMYVYSDDTDYNAVGATYTASSRLSVKNQIKLEITPNDNYCPRPTNVQVSDETTTGATISWNGNNDSYLVMVKESSQAEVTDYTYDFEDGWQGWTTLKGSNGTSPNNWMYCSDYTPRDYSSGYGHNDSDGFMISESYVSTANEGEGTAVYPDNYLVSPQVPLGGSISFWASNPNDDYGEEHFAVAVSTNGNTNVNNFTQVQEWTLLTRARRTGNTRTIIDGTWYEYTATLGNFSGMGYVAIHHFNCYDQWLLCIDDITIHSSGDDSSWTTYPTSASPFIINDLTPGTTYNVKVIGLCGNEESHESTIVSFTTLETCPAPTNVTVTNETTHGATISWSGTSDSYIVNVQQVGNAQQSGFFYDFESAEPWTITDFSPCSVYDGDQATVYGMTDCDFENESDTENPVSMSCIAFQNGKTDYLYSHSGNAFGVMICPRASTDEAANDWFILPAITIGDNYIFSFWGREIKTDWGAETINVGIYDENNPGSFSSYLTNGQNISVDGLDWTQYSFDLSAYQNQTIRLAINYVSYDIFGFMFDDIYVGSNAWDYTFNDVTSPFVLYDAENIHPETTYNVQVIGICGDEESRPSATISFTTDIACPAPTDVTVSNITAHEATVNWEGSSESYNVYLGTEGEPTNILNVNFSSGIPNNWNNDATYPWTIVDGHMQSSNGGNHSTTSEISVTLTIPSDGTIEFDAECMGEGTSTYWDHCDFYIDSNRELYAGANISGWNHYTFNVTAGQHTFKWSYTKDGSAHPTGDYFAVDNVIIISSSIIWGDPIHVENAQYTFSGLSPETNYFVKVQSDCGEEGLSADSEPVMFTTEVSCPAPTNLIVSEIDGHGATVSWDKIATQETGDITYNYTWVEHGGTPDWTNAVYAIDRWTNDVVPSGIVSGLDPETTYDFYVRRDCGEEGYSAEVMVSFTTTVTCPPPTDVTVSGITGHEATVTWTGTSENYVVEFGNYDYTATTITGTIQEEGFEGGSMPTGWTHIGNGSAEVQSSYIYDGSYSLKFSGATADNVVVLPQFPASPSSLQISFWSKAEGSSSGSFDIGYVTDASDASSFVTIQTYSYSQHSNYEYVEDISMSTAPANARIAFRHRSGETYWYWFIDDITIKGPVYPIIWTEYTTDSPTYTFEGLTPETTYFVSVQGDCGDEGMSAMSDTISFTTDVTCPAPQDLTTSDVTSNSAVLHWTGDAESYNVSYFKTFFFDSFEEDLSQWTIYKEGDEDSTEWGIENPNDNSAELNAHGGSYVAVAYSDIDIHADNWLVTPQIMMPTQATLKFWVSCSTYDDAQDEYEVLLSTTGNAVEDFTTVLKEKEAATSEWTEVVIDLSAYDGQQCYIAIRHDYTGGFYLMVDDFGIFGWSEEITTTDNSLLIEDLIPETEYLWHVQANCGEEGESAWSIIDNFTTLKACPVPFDLTVSEITANGATIAWTGYSESYNVWVGQLEMATINYDFEDNAISADFTNDATYPWTVVANNHSGSYCAKSGNALIGANSTTSEMQLEVELESDGTLSFSGKVSSESGWDKAYFSIDGIVQSDFNGISGDGDWIDYEYPLTAGTHILRWYYTKDTSNDSYDDCFYVDDITIESDAVSSEMNYTATESPLLLNDATNILPETTYLVKVKGICDGEETEYSEGIIFTTLDENTKIFVIEGDWNDGDNWVPVGVPTIDDDVILRAEATVFDVAEANIITIDETGALIIEDGGQLKTNADVEATMKKFIIGYGTDYVETSNGYYLMTLPTAVPIAAFDAGLMTEESEYDLYSWDRTATDEEWQNNHDGIDLQNGVGFLYANRDDMEMSFTATLRNSGEPVVVTPAFDDVEHGGWNLCANPFPCEAYITTDAEGMTFYRLVDNDLVPIEGAIAPLEAFFVKATAAGQTFTISREAPAK